MNAMNANALLNGCTSLPASINLYMNKLKV